MEIEKIKNWIKNRKQVVVLAAAVLFVCYFAFVSLLPLRGMAKELKLEQQQQQSLITEANVYAGQLGHFQDKLKFLQEQLDNYERKIPPQADIGQFLGQIASLMDAHSLTERSIEPQQEIRGQKFNCIAVTMKCRGRLEQIRQFYESVQKLDRSVRIEKFKLVNDRDLGGLLMMETEAIIYYRSSAGRG
ncbi:MAG: type 4a pilus biogenesis protein PilO [Phycisphaerae bacterium]